jgi:hypothetical protein
MGKRSRKGDRPEESIGKKLLKYAAIGEAKKVKKYLKRHGRGLVGAHDGCGNTALHEVNQQSACGVIHVLMGC